MSVTSGTFNSLNPQTSDLFTDAFEFAGILGPELTDLQLRSALRSSNMILQHWVNRGLNLWTVKQGMLALTAGQASYPLPTGTIAILEATIRQSNRQLGGSSFATSGNSNFAFDGNPNTACIQTAPNGNIGYTWGQQRFGISLVGVQSNINANYTLVCEYSFDNTNWFSVLNIPTQAYVQGQNNWFVVSVPVPANYFRVRETGGATLNIQELYFNTTVQDILLTPFSRHEYVSQVNKQQQGRPTSYYLDRQINPVLYLWSAPSSLFNNLFYTCTHHMEDVAGLPNGIQVPARFLLPFTVSLGYFLHLKLPQFDLQRANHLKLLSDELYTISAQEDRERVPFRIYGEYMGWTK